MKIFYWKQNSIMLIILIIISIASITSVTKKTRFQLDKSITEKLNKLVESVSSESQKEDEFKLSLLEKLKSAEQFKDEIDKKKNELEQIILHKSYKDADEDKYLKEIEHKSKEAKIMNEIQEELKKQKLEELNAFEQSITDKINLAKEKANQSVYEMIKVLNKQKKLTNYNECISESIINGKDYRDSVCKHLYSNEKEYKQCKKRKKFCSMCCSGHIGLKYEEKLFTCKERCTELISKNLP